MKQRGFKPKAKRHSDPRWAIYWQNKKQGALITRLTIAGLVVGGLAVIVSVFLYILSRSS